MSLAVRPASFTLRFPAQAPFVSQVADPVNGAGGSTSPVNGASVKVKCSGRPRKNTLRRIPALPDFSSGSTDT